VIRRLLRIGLLLGLLGGVAIALTKLLSNQEHDTPALAARPSEPWPRLTSDPAVAAPPVARAIPDPEAPASPAQAAARVWVEATAGACPTSHPVKAKLASKIFHLPGMANYDRTNADRCYVDAAAAEGDGLRAAKR
jgi:hypothetical protein